MIDKEKKNMHDERMPIIDAEMESELFRNILKE